MVLRWRVGTGGGGVCMNRTCRCLIRSSETRCRLFPDVMGLQECPGFEPWDADPLGCKHCAHDDPCHTEKLSRSLATTTPREHVGGLEL